MKKRATATAGFSIPDNSNTTQDNIPQAIPINEHALAPFHGVTQAPNHPVTKDRRLYTGTPKPAASQIQAFHSGTVSLPHAQPSSDVRASRSARIPADRATIGSAVTIELIGDRMPPIMLNPTGLVIGQLEDDLGKITNGDGGTQKKRKTGCSDWNTPKNGAEGARTLDFQSAIR